MIFYKSGHRWQWQSVNISMMFVLCSNLQAATGWSVNKLCAVLVLTWLSIFSTAAVADVLPAPTYGGPTITSAIEACALEASQYKGSTGQPPTAYNILDTNRADAKECQIWEGQWQIGHDLLIAYCYFEGQVSGSKNGHGYWPWSSINVAIVGGTPVCVCPTAQPEYDSKFGVCHGASYALNILGNTEARPSGTGGTSTVQITAKVASGDQPKPGVVVNFAVDVTANSGGHDHSDATRPKGTLSGSTGTTDANGEVKVTFTAPQVSGVHTIKATCSSCSNSPASKEIQVKVPDLLDIFSLPFRFFPRWAYPGIGQVPGRHAENHYLTVAAVTGLLGISQKFNSIWPDAPRLTLNDASLQWGGKFDIPGTWERNPRAHAEHRIGDNIDVRANSAPGAVPITIRAKVFRWFRNESTEEDAIPPEFAIESVNPLWENPITQNEHFHLRLGN